MKTPESIKKEQLKVSSDDANNLKVITQEINDIVNKKTVEEDTIRKLTNIITTLDAIRDNYYWRLLRASKQNHMID
jgi:hypothetical protein